MALKRPNLVRHATDDGIGSSATPVAGRVLNGDRGVRVNLLTSPSMSLINANGKKGRSSGLATPGIGGRLSAMARGSEGRYVVGGGQCE